MAASTSTSLGQAASEAAFERTVDMVATMAHVPDLLPRIWARIESVVTADTRVLVGHSLGSVISYGALRRNPQWNVHTFVTLGSPLGQPMVLDQLNPPVDAGDGWPGSIQRWVNVRRGRRQGGVGQPARRGATTRRVEDVLVDNGHRAHDPEPYLNAAATGAAIAAGLAATA